ncbi:MAG: hypothetical protein GX758_02105 [Tenericutes bacterium]|nr:hypothetical protein [Mycoplasmatota bacterium]
MYGAIIGDMSGSLFEYSEFVDSMNKVINLKRRMEILSKKSLIDKESFFSDDTILTIAVLDALLTNKSFEPVLKRYILFYSDYKPKIEKYFKHPFSPNTMKWAKSNIIANSIGNGSAMRVSPVGYLCNSKEEVLEKAKLSAIPTHNSESGIKGAQAVAYSIFLAREGYKNSEIESQISDKFKYNLDLNLDNLRKTNTFSSICDIVVPQSIYCALSSSTFDESIRKAISIGGDTDTIACITGSIAEALYKVDRELVDIVDEHIPSDFQKKLKIGYSKII